MSVFDETSKFLEILWNKNFWCKRKNTSPLNLESCNGVAKSDKNTNTCEMCVALNDTVFNNDNKPLYNHPHCKCNFKPQLNVNIVLDFSVSKITNYLFYNQNKKAMMKSMGFALEDWREIYDFVSQNIKTCFLNNLYQLKNLDIFGQHFQINFKLKGKNDHYGEYFNCHSGCVAYPNGKIKIATPLIKD